MRRAHTRSSPDHTQHRNKRQFQPSITTFFASDERNSPAGSDDDDLRGSGPITRAHASPRRQQQHHHHHQQQQRDSLAPSLPGPVQADLLSVGMRVRKSVPEGYKTHKTVTMPSIQTTLSISPNSAATATATTEYGHAVPEDAQHQRELLPFCGLQKIGGYAEQPVTNVHLYGGTDASGSRAVNVFPLPAEAFTQPFSPQSSTSSSISNSSVRPNPANPSKRSWQDDNDKPTRLSTNFHFKLPLKVSEDEVPVSPMSETPPQRIDGFPQAALRPFAQPKTRRARAMDLDGMVVKEADVDMDVENADQAEGRVLVGSASDFGEAEFLTPWTPGREVDMGGL